MSKQTKGYDMANFAHVTPAMIEGAKNVIEMQGRRSYSVSAIYKAHNGIFKLREAMQTCDSCLVTRANAIKKWYDWYAGQAEDTTPPSADATNISEIVSKYRFVTDGTPEGDRATFGTLIETNYPPLSEAELQIVKDHLAALPPVQDDNAINEEVFKGLGLSDDATPQAYSAAIKAFIEDPAQMITDDRRAWLVSKAAAIDAQFPPIIAVGGLKPEDRSDLTAARKEALKDAQSTDPNAASYVAPQRVEAPDASLKEVAAGVVKNIAPQPVEVLLQQVDKDDYSKTKGNALFALFAPSADDATKGMVANKETGKSLAAGTYATEDTTKVLSVQPGGKATYKAIA